MGFLYIERCQFWIAIGIADLSLVGHDKWFATMDLLGVFSFIRKNHNAMVKPKSCYRAPDYGIGY